MTLTEWASANVGTVITIIMTFFSIVGGMYKIYYDHLAMKREMESHQSTTGAMIRGIQAAKEQRHAEVEKRFREQEELIELKVQNASLEAEKKINELRQLADKRYEEQNKLIHELLINTNKIGVNVEFLAEGFKEFKENFYRENSNRKK